MIKTIIEENEYIDGEYTATNVYATIGKAKILLFRIEREDRKHFITDIMFDIYGIKANYHLSYKFARDYALNTIGNYMKRIPKEGALR